MSPAPTRKPPSRDSVQDRATLERIADLMRSRVFDLVRGPWDLRDGWREGHDWVCRNPLRGDKTAKSFRVSLSGPYQGMVKDFAGPFGRSGKDAMSALSFHAELLHNGDMGAAVRWAKAWGGLDGANPEALRQTQRALVSYDDRADSDAEEVEKKRRRAKAIYLDAPAGLVDTPVDEYLRGRGLDIRALPYPMRCLRFHPRLYCAELGKPDQDSAYLPAMVAPINGMAGAVLGVHRTYLSRNPDGRWVKAALKNPKKTYGPYQGGVIRLWNGCRFDPETGEVFYGRKLGELTTPGEVDITEGIEDALSVAIACPDARVVAGVSLSNMVGLAFPPLIEQVRFWRQNDPADSAAARQFERAVNNTYAQGKRVVVVDIPPEWKDPNEVLQGNDR